MALVFKEFVLVVHWDFQGLAYEHGDGYLSFVAAGSIDGAKFRAAGSAYQFAALFCQIPQTLRAKQAWVVVAQSFQFMTGYILPTVGP